MTPNRPHLRAVDAEPGREQSSGAPPRRARAVTWVAVALVALGVLGWWLFALEAADLRRTQAELARSQARVFSLEARMLQVRRSASALAATLGAAEEQARALEALALPEEAARDLDAPPAPAPARDGRTDGGR